MVALKEGNSFDYDICVGVVVAADGVRGHVKIKSFTDNPKDIESFSYLFDAEGREYKIKILATKKDCLVVSIDGVTNRNHAEQLRNVRFYIKRSGLPSVEADEYYHADLIGLKVKAQDGLVIGEVISIMNFGAGDILEIKDEFSEKAVYYPLSKQFVSKIDVNNRFIEVMPLEEIIATTELDA